MPWAPPSAPCSIAPLIELWAAPTTSSSKPMIASCERGCCLHPGCDATMTGAGALAVLIGDGGSVLALGRAATGRGRHLHGTGRSWLGAHAHGRGHGRRGCGSGCLAAALHAGAHILLVFGLGLVGG